MPRKRKQSPDQPGGTARRAKAIYHKGFDAGRAEAFAEIDRLRGAPHCWFAEAPDGENSAGPFDTREQAEAWAKDSAVHAPHYAAWRPFPLYRAPVPGDEVEQLRAALAERDGELRKKIHGLCEAIRVSVSDRASGMAKPAAGDQENAGQPDTEPNRQEDR